METSNSLYHLSWPRYHNRFTYSKNYIMKKNMGNLDRIIRLAVVAIVAILYFTQVIDGTTAIVLGVIAGIFLLTSLVSFCPLYAIVGLSTCKVKETN